MEQPGAGRRALAREGPVVEVAGHHRAPVEHAAVDQRRIQPVDGRRGHQVPDPEAFRDRQPGLVDLGHQVDRRPGAITFEQQAAANVGAVALAVDAQGRCLQAPAGGIAPGHQAATKLHPVRRRPEAHRPVDAGDGLRIGREPSAAASPCPARRPATPGAARPAKARASSARWLAAGRGVARKLDLVQQARRPRFLQPRGEPRRDPGHQ